MFWIFLLAYIAFVLGCAWHTYLTGKYKMRISVVALLFPVFGSYFCCELYWDIRLRQNKSLALNLSEKEDLWLLLIMILIFFFFSLPFFTNTFGLRQGHKRLMTDRF
jgi:uncharacterized membrane protein YoaK (UPF0700 family)